MSNKSKPVVDWGNDPIRDALKKALDGLTQDELVKFFDQYSVDDIAVQNDGVWFNSEFVIEEMVYDGDGLIQKVVYKFSHGKNEFLIQFFGTYMSYVGSTYHGWRFVTASQKVVTVYE